MSNLNPTDPRLSPEGRTQAEAEAGRQAKIDAAYAKIEKDQADAAQADAASWKVKAERRQETELARIKAEELERYMSTSGATKADFEEFWSEQKHVVLAERGNAKALEARQSQGALYRDY